MMDIREKLVEIMENLGCNDEYCKDCEFCNDIDGCVHRQKEIIADRLIANGVTVQEWVSVDDRLPEMGEHYQSEDVLVCIDYRPDDPDTTKDSYVSIDHVDFNCFGQGWFSCERDDPRDGEPSPYFVTHWMPMPLVESTGLICHSRRKENDNETD